MTTEKLLRWNGTTDDALKEMDRRNSWHSAWEGIKESNKIDIVWGNMDETNMSAAEGKLCRYRVPYLPQISIISSGLFCLIHSLLFRCYEGGSF